MISWNIPWSHGSKVVMPTGLSYSYIVFGVKTNDFTSKFKEKMHLQILISG